MRYGSFSEYRRAWDSAESETPPIPLNVDIELSATCNLKCPFCFISDPQYKKPSTPFMSVDLAYKIIDECAEIGVPALKFNWRGEPTIHPEFSSVVKYAKSKGCFYDLLVNTNGNGPIQSINGLMAATKVIVSIDSFNDDIYKAHRVGGSLSKTIGTFRTLLNEGHTGLVLRRVVTEKNEKEDYWRSAEYHFGFDGYAISEHYEFPRGGNSQKANFHRRYCAYPSQRLVISTDGTMFPCCVDYGCAFPLGRFPETGILEAWAGEKMVSIREALKSLNMKRWPAVCRNCTSWASYDCAAREKLKS